MQDLDFAEKRSFPRFTVSIPLNYFDTDSSEMVYTQTHDISAQGLSVLIDKELMPDTPLDIFLQMLDNGEKIYRRGKVMWSNIIDSDEYRIGIKLEEPDLKPIPLVLRTIVAHRP